MAIVIKRRARSTMANGFPNVAIYPHGVGGIDGTEECIGLEIGDIRIIMKQSEWLDMIEAVLQLDESL